MIPIKSAIKTSLADDPDGKRLPYLPLAVPSFGDEEKNAVLAVLESGWVTTGAVNAQFERDFAEFVGVPVALALNSCTAALHISLLALDVGPGDAVITSTLTFAATVNVICHTGATPVLMDVRRDTYNIDENAVAGFLEEKCAVGADGLCRIKTSGQRVRAIIAVHYGGHPCEMDRLRSLCKQYGLALIEDAAHAVGAKYRDENVGAMGDLSCFSFYATKNLCTGEGGMVTSATPQLAARLRCLSLHGMSQDAWKRYSKNGSWRYDIVEPGFKYNLTDIASALGIHQLRKLPEFTRRRSQLAAMYTRALQNLRVRTPVVLPWVSPAWHLYAIELENSAARDRVFETFTAQNIGASVHFIPVHLMSYYQKEFGYRPGDFPVAESIFSRMLSLPMFPAMADEDVSRVADALSTALAE